jgi:hypothetical protein
MADLTISGISAQFDRLGVAPGGSAKPTSSQALMLKLLVRSAFRGNLVRAIEVLPMPLVLVENERTAGGRFDHWADVTGVSYQFPNQYRNKIMPGEVFVYYRGARRSDGKRGTPEYFGVGRIAEVLEDPTNDPTLPKSKRRWNCQIRDYQPFLTPVPFKIGGRFLEEIPSNFWGVAVRDLPESTMQRILQLAGLEVLSDPESQPVVQPALPPIEAVSPLVIPSSDSLMVPRPSTTKVGGDSRGGSSRRSRHAMMVGRRAEEIVLNLLTSENRSRVRWVAAEGKTPGWDIEYWAGDHRIAIEVKGTSGKGFPSVELTAGELKAARDIGSNYWLYLVADCLGTAPSVQKINNPGHLIDQGILESVPVLYRISAIQAW